jgi:circadian clock protein KaiB
MRRPDFVLRLYVAGNTMNSMLAVRTVRAVCRELRCELEVIDVYQAKGVAARDQVIAIPTLVRKYPLPERRFVGNLSSRARVLAALGVEVAHGEP